MYCMASAPAAAAQLDDLDDDVEDRARRLATVILSTTNLFVSFRWQQNEQLAHVVLAIAVVFTTMRGRGQVGELKVKLAALESQCAADKAQLSADKALLNGRLSSVSSKVEALSQSLSSEKTVRSQLEMVNSTLTARVGQSRKELRQSARELKRLQQSNASLAEWVVKARKQLKHKDELVRDMRAEAKAHTGGRDRNSCVRSSGMRTSRSSGRIGKEAAAADVASSSLATMLVDSSSSRSSQRSSRGLGATPSAGTGSTSSLCCSCSGGGGGSGSSYEDALAAMRMSGRRAEGAANRRPAGRK